MERTGVMVLELTSKESLWAGEFNLSGVFYAHVRPLFDSWVDSRNVWTHFDVLIKV